MWLALAMWPNRIFGPLDHVRDVLDAKRRAALGFQDGLLDVLHAAEEPERADVHLLQAFFHKAAAGIDVVVGQLLLDLADAQSVRRRACSDPPAPGTRAPCRRSRKRPPRWERI